MWLGLKNEPRVLSSHPFLRFLKNKTFLKKNCWQASWVLLSCSGAELKIIPTEAQYLYKVIIWSLACCFKQHSSLTSPLLEWYMYIFALCRHAHVSKYMKQRGIYMKLQKHNRYFAAWVSTLPFLNFPVTLDACHFDRTLHISWMIHALFVRIKYQC